MNNGYVAARRFVLFAHGFRPFFLLAGINALWNMSVWLLIYFHPQWWPASAFPAMYWHAHEMLFGFVSAAIAGFLLTAVPGWTGRASYPRKFLILLSLIWLFGRLVMLPGTYISPLLAAAVDLAFFPALVITLAPSLIRARKIRNLPFLALLTALFLTNLLFHLGRITVLPGGEHIGLGIATDIVCVLIAIVGGRIIPAFTQSGLSRRGLKVDVEAYPVVEYAAITSVVCVLAIDLIAPLSQLSGAVALFAGLIQAVRLAQWQGHRSFRDPLIWVLHIGYAWLTVGLLLKGAWFLFAADFAEKWVHALTVGAFTTMILAVMTRASLGHTGRALLAPVPISVAYILISLAAAMRVFGPAVLPPDYESIILIAGTCWITAFALYLLIYAPILLGPRVDGKPG